MLAVTGKHLQQWPAVLVAAVLGPERAEHPQLDLVRLAVEQVDDPLVLFERKRKLRQRPCIGGHRSQGIRRARLEDEELSSDDEGAATRFAVPCSP